MIKTIVSATILAILPVTVFAGNTTRPVERPVVAEPVIDPRPLLMIGLRAGVGVAPSYFGSDQYKAVPDFAIGFQYLRLPNGPTYGSEDPNVVPQGFVPRGSVRFIRARTSADNPELTGLDDIDMSVELGLGVGYRQRHFRAFADARYGVIGHNAWVGELGADAIIYPTDRLILAFGPRMHVGDAEFANTYFGVTPAESTASGLAAYTAGGGALSAGLELNAVYKINDNWGLVSAVRWERLLNDAADSPITAMGSVNQYKFRVSAVRRFSLRF